MKTMDPLAGVDKDRAKEGDRAVETIVEEGGELEEMDKHTDRAREIKRKIDRGEEGMRGGAQIQSEKSERRSDEGGGVGWRIYDRLQEGRIVLSIRKDIVREGPLRGRRATAEGGEVLGLSIKTPFSKYCVATRLKLYKDSADLMSEVVKELRK